MYSGSHIKMKENIAATLALSGAMKLRLKEVSSLVWLYFFYSVSRSTDFCIDWSCHLAGILCIVVESPSTSQYSDNALDLAL